MSIWGEATDPIDWQPMGGTATFGEIFSAARDAAVFGSEANSEAAAFEKAYDDRIDAIRANTGIVLENPMRKGYIPILSAPEKAFSQGWFIKTEQARSAFDQQIADLAQKHPDQRDAIRAGTPIADDAHAIMRGAEESFGQRFASANGVAPWIAALAGGMAGDLRNPLSASLMLAGGGPGAARSVGGRILEQTIKEAAINAGSQAIVEPFVQGDRAAAGLESGLKPALKDIGLAAVFGGAFGGGLQGLGEGIGAALKRFGLVADDLPEAARGAIAAVEDDHALATSRPPSVDPETHDQVVAHAIAAAEDPAQISEAIARTEAATADITPRRPAPAKEAAPVSLFRFLGGSGGLKDAGGELRAMGLDKTLVPRHGRLVRPTGLDLDHAREIAAEAGYFDAKYGTPEKAMAQSTVSDLLDALSEESLGRKVYTLADQDRIANPTAPADRRLQAKQRWVDSQLGDAVPPALRERTAELIHQDGASLDDALERAIMEDYYAGGPAPARVIAGGQEHEVPFFDDHPIDRGNAPERGPLPGDGEDGNGSGRSGPAAADGEAPGLSGGADRRPAGAELAGLETLPQAAPLEPGPEAAAQTDRLLKSIEDPASVTIADGVTLQAELDDVRHLEGMAGLVDACRLLP